MYILDIWLWIMNFDGIYVYFLQLWENYKQGHAIIL